jgi:hypothetical protein
MFFNGLISMYVFDNSLWVLYTHFQSHGHEPGDTLLTYLAGLKVAF